LVGEACPQVAALSPPLVAPELAAGMDFWPGLRAEYDFLKLIAGARKFETKLHPLSQFLDRIYNIFV